VPCNLYKYEKSKPTHWVGSTGTEYSIDEYTNHGYGGIYKGFLDLPLNEYPYFLKFKVERKFKFCELCNGQCK
jgi:hypothetical protein